MPPESCALASTRPAGAQAPALTVPTAVHQKHSATMTRCTRTIPGLILIANLERVASTCRNSDMKVILGQIWCRIEESNPRPSHYKCAALPTELIRRLKGYCSP